jgi:diguanylate cyclase (GGDEF)-like protein
MSEQHFLILNKIDQEAERLKILCQPLGSVHIASSIEETISLVEKIEFNVLVVDESFGRYSSLKGLFRATTSIVITGIVGKKLNEIAKSWPLIFYVDYHLVPLEDRNNESLLRALITASEHSFLKIEVEKLNRTKMGSDLKLQEAYFEIKKIKHFINNSVVNEIQKRMSVEAKYLGVKKEKQKIESTLKKLYIANDITSLLDIVYDIKDIVKARGISIYIQDENETLGKYLKPLVWNDAILSLPDSARHFVLLDSDDFAAYATQHAQVINLTGLSNDKRLSPRYLEEMPYDLKNILCVPIMHDLDAIGVLEVYNKASLADSKKSGFTAEDQKNMIRFCEHISIAITKLNLIQYDPLTGLLRPDAFFDKVIQKLRLGRKRHQEGSSFAMVLGDVDWFKNYNDRNGHEAGNRLLRELAGVLKFSIREEDLICRYGGEEFLLFLSGIASGEEALGFTERIRKNIEAHHFENQEFQPNNNLTMSFGLTYFSRDRIKAWDVISKTNLKKLANEADIGMAEAKGKKRASLGLYDSHKNKVCLYNRDRLKEFQEPPAIENREDRFERRKNKRFHTSTILVYKREDFYRVTKTINLSLGGAKIPTDSLLDLHQVFDLILILGKNACQVKGEVVYSMMAGDNYSHYFSGIKFLDMQAKERKILENYFSSLDPREGYLPN